MEYQIKIAFQVYKQCNTHTQKCVNYKMKPQIMPLFVFLFVLQNVLKTLAWSEDFCLISNPVKQEIILPLVSQEFNSKLL